MKVDSEFYSKRQILNPPQRMTLKNDSSFGEAAKPQSPQQQTSPRRPVDSSETWNYVVLLPTKETAILRKMLKLEADSDQFATN